MAQVFGLQQTNGTASVTNASPTLPIVAAQGAGKVFRITKGVIGITLAATAGGGLVKLVDGSTLLMQWDANSVNSFPFDFGDAGYPGTANTALNLTVSGAAGNQASATCALVGLVA